MYKSFSEIKDYNNPNHILVFGSNTQGRHGKGSALLAKTNYGAKNGLAKGPQGNCYAIITKDLTKRIHPSVSKGLIIQQISELYKYAIYNSELEFLIPYKNEPNLNNYTPLEMADMFILASKLTINKIPENIVFHESFIPLLIQK